MNIDDPTIGGRIDREFRAPADRGRDMNPVAPLDKVIQAITLPVAPRSGCICIGEEPCASQKRGCPAGNPIPELNRALEKILQLRLQSAALTAEKKGAEAQDFDDAARKAVETIYWNWRKTMPFFGWTGRICGAPCQDGCIKAISHVGGGVQIRNHELLLYELAKEYGIHRAYPPDPGMKLQGKRVAVIGSGPAGLAAAKALNTICDVTIFEKETFPGGLLTTGIPTFKLEPELVHDEIKIMRQEGITFELGKGVTADSFKKLMTDYDAVVVAVGAGEPRQLKQSECPGIQSRGVLYWDTFLANQKYADYAPERFDQKLSVKDQDVVIYGYGATAEDVIATSVRQGARSIHVVYRGINFDVGPGLDSWDIRREESLGHHGRYGTEEARAAASSKRMQEFAVHMKGTLTEIRSGESGDVTGVLIKRESDLNGATPPQEIQAQRVIIAIGPKGPTLPFAADYGMETDRTGAFKSDANFMTATGNNKIFLAGDCRAVPQDQADWSASQKLVVRAIAEGLKAAAGVRGLFTGTYETYGSDPLMPARE